jgi:hypothetical protein
VIITENQNNDPYIKKWLTGLSERTKQNYLREFPKWVSFVKLNPTEQINKRLKDLTSQNLTERTYFENKFREYKEHLEQEGKLGSTSITTMLRTVASFFSRNDLSLNLKHGDWKTTLTQEVTKPQFKLKQEDIKAMYAHANLRDRTLLLVLAQSGFSEVDVSELKIEDIQGLFDMNMTEHYFIEKRREKTNEMQATCLSCEFLHDLRNLLEENGKPQAGYIFTSQTKQTFNPIKAEFEPIDTRRINEIMKNLAIKTFGKEKAKLFKTKSLRSFYNSALLRTDMKQEIKDLMMGHARMGARSKYAYDDITIKENYAKAFEHLSINGIQVKEDFQKLKEDMNRKAQDQDRELNALRSILLMVIDRNQLEQLVRQRITESNKRSLERAKETGIAEGINEVLFGKDISKMNKAELLELYSKL